MPASSLIVGVDLAPIKPIPRTITFQSDITTDKCRATIRQHLKTWKADTVLHDGAPNVGAAWVQDAFTQAELAFQAFKLATEFLIEGGTFVTKVFRSKDYNALLWVFNQLFTKVEATKPPSSRNVSAEIFVVCRGYKAPKRIDPKFLDPRSVFAELADPTPNNEAKVFNPEKKKRKRDGYEEGDYTQFKEASASEFVNTNDPIAMLGSLNKLSFEHQVSGDIALAALDKLPETTPEIRQCCLDLKVLGRKEFRMLLKWRLKAREIFGFSSKETSSKDKQDDEIAEVGSMDEELKIQEELQRLDENKNSRKRREKRRENERKQKEIVRMQLHMLPPTEIGLEQKGPNGEDSMFALAAVDKAGAVEQVSRGKMGLLVQPPAQATEDSSDEESDEEENRLDEELDALYSEYQERKSESDAKYRAKRLRKEHEDGEWEGFSEGKLGSDEELEVDEESEASSEEDGDASAQRMPKSLSHAVDSHKKTHSVLTKRASQFFEQEIFKDICTLDLVDQDSAIDVDEPSETNNGAKKEEKTGMANPRVAQKGHEMSKTKESSGHYVCEKDDKEIPKNRAEQDGEVDEENDPDTNFEIARDPNHSEWEKQGERGIDGRLGKSTQIPFRLLSF